MRITALSVGIFLASLLGCSDGSVRPATPSGFTDVAVTPDATDASEVASTDALDVTTAADASVDSDAPIDALDASNADAPDASDVFVVRLPDGGATCHAVVNDSPEVVITAGAGAPPEPRGGVIVSGHYHLRGFEVFGSMETVGTRSFQTADIGDGVFLLAARTAAGDTRWSSTYTLSGTDMSISRVCPSRDTQGTIGYTATTTTVTFITTTPTLTTVVRYERQ